MKRCLLLIALITALWAASAQAEGPTAVRKYRRAIEGTVYDSTSGNPIPYATVQVEGTRRSTLTNDEGYYRILLDDGPQTIRFSHIAYYSQERAFTGNDSARTVDIHMVTSLVDLGTIRVYTRDYDDGQRIIVEAIRRKEEILNRFRDFRYQAYTKVVIADLTKAEAAKDRIFLIAESQTTAYWEQPDKYKEVITSRRQTANIQAEANLVSVGEIANFNKSRIDLDPYSIVSPTAFDALDHYNYYLLDTLYYDSMRVFHLEVEPKNPRDPLFAGTIDIADSTYDVVSVDVTLSEGCQFPMIENPRYALQGAYMENGYWLPVEMRFSADVEFDVPLPFVPRRLGILQQATLHDYEVNVGQPEDVFDEYLIEVDEKADNFDSTAWFAAQTLALNDQERAAYRHIDSVKSLPPSAWDIAKMSVAGALFITGGGAVDFFHFNRAEGAYTGFGIKPYLRRLNTDLRLKAGYAWDAELAQWQIGFTHQLDKQQRLDFGFDYLRQVRKRPTIFSGPNTDATAFAIWSQYDPFDYHRVEGFEAFVGAKLLDYTRLQLKYSNLEYRSMRVNTDFSLGGDVDPRANPMVAEGKMRSLTASFTWDSRRLFRIKRRDLQVDELPFTVFTAEVEYASPDLIDNDFDFRRYTISLTREQRLLGLGSSTVRIMAGSADGNLPPQKYHMVDYGDFLVYDANIVKTLDERNFGGDRLLSVNWVHRFRNRLWVASGIPVIEDIPLWLNAHGAVFWSDFRNIKREEVEPDLLIARTPYAEAGFGLGNLTPFLAPFNLEVNFTWQVSRYDTNRWSWEFGFDF